jgi:small subunit ribosomal protein S4e
MARGVKKHLKRVYAPSHWMLDKLTGVWAPRPSTGPHKLRECMPLIILLRNRLKYALTYNEVKMIVKQRLIKVDGKVRTDMTYPAGLMDVISIDQTREHFRLLWDTKGRFAVHKIGAEEAEYKLCRVKKLATGKQGLPYVVTHDGRTIRLPDPDVKPNDTIKVNIATGGIDGHLKFDMGKMVTVIGGNNIGRVGVMTHREKHQGSFDIIHVKDKQGITFATRMSNVMVIGQEKPWISLPAGEGIKLNVVEDRYRRLKK